MRKIAIFVLLVTGAISFLHATEILKLDFNKYPDGMALDKDKWQAHMPVSNEKASTYIIKDGKLEVISNPAEKLRGGYIEMDIPLMRKGSVEFDLNVNHDEKGVGLFIEFYNITLFWHDYCKDWRRYFPEATAKRLPYYNNEPVGHRRLGNVDKNKWLHYKVCFDTDNDLVEYYQGDMVDPVYVDDAAAVLGRQEYLGGKLRIGCWGVNKVPMKFLIDNVVVSSADAKAESGNHLRNAYVILNGMSFNRYDIAGCLQKNGVADNQLRNYYIENPKSALTPENKFFIDKLPGSIAMKRAAACVMVDCPLGPRQIIPEHTLKSIMANVNDGMKLVILGGLFSLGKGEYQNSYLNDFLPVKLKDAWQVKKAAAPLIIQPVADKYKNIDWSASPAVYYYHDLEPVKETQVLLTAGKQPLLVSKKYGKGEVIVFLGTVCGTATDNSIPFWKWKNWPELATEIIK